MENAKGTLYARRLSMSKNIILFLNSTKNRHALREDLDSGIKTISLPQTVIYPDFIEKSCFLLPDLGEKTSQVPLGYDSNF